MLEPARIIIRGQPNLFFDYSKNLSGTQIIHLLEEAVALNVHKGGVGRGDR